MSDNFSPIVSEIFMAVVLEILYPLQALFSVFDEIPAFLANAVFDG